MNENAFQRVKLWTPELDWEERADGSFVIWRKDSLGAYPAKLNDRFVHWAKVAPDRIWMAERQGDGWRRLTYKAALEDIRRIAQVLLDLDLGPERPVVILGDNSIEHALIALAAQHVGIPSAAISPSYATLSSDFSKLSSIAHQITPGLVFVADGEKLRDAVDQAFGADIPLVALRNVPVDRPNSQAFTDLLDREATQAVDQAFAKVGPDTVAKFLFTSGTTGSPKAVIQTQRMLCANQEMVANCYAFLRDEPPVIIDWGPWNHTASGNKVFNLVIYNGGTFYLDDGKPSPALMEKTIANLREISPTWYFNVPAGYEMLVRAMQADEALRANFFKNLKLLMYAGAGMAQHTWDALNGLAEQTVGERIPFGTGLGSTETGPFSIYCTDPQEAPGNIGVPAPGITLKLVPFEDKFELRLKGPNITPGYWRNQTLTEQAFDEEGFYKIGDAVRFAVGRDPRKGFYFDGRTAENFKLRTGTWVAVGKLRAHLVDIFGGLIRDAVITGENREELGALVVPFLPALREVIGASATGLSDEAVLDHPVVQAALAERLKEHQRLATGSATRVMRLLIMKEAPRFERGEITDKGSLNQRAVLSQRPELVERLYAGSSDVIRVEKEVAA
ncbi:feruloyl-CoA synthase [Agrobacterium larrymoorei]|uniref:Feruloyl-CoA synthase n=1 Tax=Agrobacterium larrymoorei TaxID=160699 RepID=A0A4D7DSR6_9HYPH|nr:feruloyl-CoA synthase [Agrobacterium larrymoorei]QCI99508.1 feruloyl-CoA synthase [Agrobacterium larrymoorei]QYA09054.1 feruloyl-CoA synthase [Agrobacterium larrymoorei]